MKKIIVFALIIGSISTKAQTPIKWIFTAKKIADKTYEVHITGLIEKSWSTYSQTTPEGGPSPTSISFLENPLILLDGKIKEIGEMKKKHEMVFGVDVYYYKDKVDFVQVIKVKNNVKTKINGTVEFMACNDEKCLPPEEVPFSIKLQ